MVARELSVLLLTEDAGDAAHATIAALVAKILRLIEPGFDASRLKFSRADERARMGLRFACYKSRSPRDHGKKLVLAQTIANHLLGSEGPAAVFVHVDGERRWSERDPELLCDNVRGFLVEILRRVRAILDARGRGELIDHVALLVPFWSIESWLFHNTDEALRICAAGEQRYADAAEWFEKWRAEPRRLDEHPNPKQTICFAGKYNQRLAESDFPARRLLELEQSFADTVDRIERSSLRALIAATSPRS